MRAALRSTPLKMRAGRRVRAALAAGILFALAGGATAHATGATVPASVPASVPIPAPATAPPQRIADAWFAHNSVLAMLGAADRVVVTVARPASFQWLYRIAPVMHRAEVVDGSTLNAEELLRQHADLVFTTPNAQLDAALGQIGLKVIPVTFDDFTSMQQCIDRTADALETPLAHRRAAAFHRYMSQTLDDIGSHTNTLPAAKRPTVLHIASFRPLKVDGDRTIVEQWIDAAGGRNAAVGLHGNLRPVSMEQVLAWQPDVIIVAANAGKLPDDPLWQQLHAVRQHRVLLNPAGVFPWDRYGPEVALQVRWAARELHPDLFPDNDIVTRTQAFYRMFFDYPLTVPEAERIIAGQPPAP